MQNKIEFQSIPSQYPLGENIYCYFIVPGTTQPEHGDYIGLFQVGWKNVSDLTCKKVIKIENVWGPMDQKFGHVIFESSMLPSGQNQHQQQQGNKFYQFVYVKNGGTILGVSKPFTFGQVPQQMNNGPRSYGIQQWINKFKQTIGVSNDEFSTQNQTQHQQHSIQYQQGLKALQKGLEQVLCNECDGVKSMQQGLQYIQQYTQLAHTIPQKFYQEVRKIQQGVQELEQICAKGKTELENSNVRQVVQKVQQGLQELRKTMPVPVSVMVQEPMVLRRKIQDILAGMPIESTWGQKHWEELINTVVQFLREQEKLEKIQRELEQERLVSHVKTLEVILMNQQKIEDENQEYLKSMLEKKVRDFQERCGNSEHVNKQHAYEQLLNEKLQLDAEKRVVIRMKLNQLIKEIVEEISELKQREQQHMITTGQKLTQLISQFEGKPTVELLYLRELVLDLVSGQVLSQVGLRAFYKELSDLLDEIDASLRELELNNRPTTRREQEQVDEQFKMRPYENSWSEKLQGGDKCEFEDEENKTGYPLVEQSKQDWIHISRAIHDFKSEKSGDDLKIVQDENKLDQLDNKDMYQQNVSKTSEQGPYSFEQMLTQLKEWKGLKEQERQQQQSEQEKEQQKEQQQQQTHHYKTQQEQEQQIVDKHQIKQQIEQLKDQVEQIQQQLHFILQQLKL